MWTIFVGRLIHVAHEPLTTGLVVDADLIEYAVNFAQNWTVEWIDRFRCERLGEKVEQLSQCVRLMHD